MVEISNVKVYELEESIVSSGYATRLTLDDATGRVDNLKEFTKDSKFLPLFHSIYSTQNKNIGEDNRESCFKCGSPYRIQKFTKDGHFYCGKHSHHMHRYGYIVDNVEYNFINKYDVEIKIKGDKNVVKTAIISSIDIPYIIGKNLSIDSNGYLKVDGMLFHRFLFKSLGISFDQVDHIDRNVYNNTRRNLRPCTRYENLRNRTSSLGKDKFIGIFFDKERGNWRSFINFGGKRKELGRFKNEEEAKIARLKAESKYYGEFSPNLQFFSKYDIELPYVSRLKDEIYSLKDAYNDWNRMSKLCKLPSNSGHNNALTGIRVAFDIKYPNYFSPELQRYHFIDIVTSSSKMHKLMAMDFSTSCNKYVIREIIEQMEYLRSIYNKVVEHGNKDEIYTAWMTLLSNCPLGIELFMRVNTNYMQLRNLYHQRKAHKLKEDWGAFCDMIRELPYFEEFINK